MQLPQHLQGADEDRVLDYLIDRLQQRTRFRPGKQYKLNVRKKHPPEVLERLRKTHPEFFKDTGLLKRTESWNNYRPIQYINIPRRENASRAQTALEDLRTEKDFFEYFTSTFPDLDDGVYAGIQRKGKGHGYSTLCILELKNGKVNSWLEKSKNQDDNPSRYYVLPLYFKWRDDLGV